jgi:hypothetical protein
VAAEWWQEDEDERLLLIQEGLGFYTRWLQMIAATMDAGMFAFAVSPGAGKVKNAAALKELKGRTLMRLGDLCKCRWLVVM